MNSTPRNSYHPLFDVRFSDKLVKTEGKKAISVTHITVRQSIFFLLLKLIAVELFAAGLLILFHSVWFTHSVQSQIPEGLSLFNIPVFLILVAIKTFITFYIIFEWLDEYYEITTNEIIHKRGYFFKHEEHHALNHLVSMRVTQGAFGRFFNFGTITLFNWAKNREVYLYLIHNPLKYAHILEYLLPEPVQEKHMVREKIIEEEDDTV